MVKMEWFLSERAKSWIFSIFLFWTNTLGMIFNVIYTIKPIMRGILEIFKARIPLKLKISRKTSLLLKISWTLYNNNANLSKCLLIPTYFPQICSTETVWGGTLPSCPLQLWGLGAATSRKSLRGSLLHVCKWQSRVGKQLQRKKIGLEV